MKFILGTKQTMVQFFDGKGKAYAATLLSAGPVVVTDVRTPARDGYSAVQVGFGTQKEARVSKPQRGAWKDLGLFRYVREFRLKESEAEKFARGTTIDAGVFAPGDTIAVAGISKGKGFQGVVKRHGFKGGPRSHGQSHSERAPGSIGATWPQRVLKGKRMAGRMGSDRVMVKNLTVLAVDKDTNTMLVSGAVPGRRGTLVEVCG